MTRLRRKSYRLTIDEVSSYFATYCDARAAAPDIEDRSATAEGEPRPRRTSPQLVSRSVRPV